MKKLVAGSMMSLQYCSLNGKKSSSQPVTCGIPQGSCLGPLLFILYLNDFETCLKFSKANLYCDDTEVSLSSNETGDLRQNFQSELENISEWMRINKLSIHPEKPSSWLLTILVGKANYQSCHHFIWIILESNKLIKRNT